VHADQTKYGSILTGLTMQQFLRNNQYPKTTTKANNVLSNHKFDVARFANKTQTKMGMIKQSMNQNRKRSTYPLHNWKASVSVAARWGTSYHSANSRINQRQNGLSTKTNKAMLKQARQNPRSPNLCKRATNNNPL
jgi:hypothetical protein